LTSAKPKSKSSVKAAIGAVRDFIGGHQEDEETVPSANLVDRNSAAVLPADEEVKMETENLPDQNAIPEQPRSEAVQPELDQNQRGPETELPSREFAPSEDFDQAVRDLRAGESPETRAAAARILAGAGRQRATPHLIAALFDADATVRTTANEVLAQFGNSSAPGNETAESKATGESRSKPAAAKHPAPKQTRARVETVTVTKPQPARSKVEKPAAAISQPVPAGAAATKDPQQLLVEENEVRTKLKEVEAQILDTAAARKEVEKEIRRHIEREAKLRMEAAARRDEEEQLRKQAYEEAERRLAEDVKAVAAEQKTRVAAEKEARRLAEDVR